MNATDRPSYSPSRPGPARRWQGLLLGLLAVVLPAASAFAQTQPIPVSEDPLFARAPQPPLNMLVVGRDQKLFNAAYNDSSDLDGDGTLDVGYKPSIDYYGYFDSHKCYTYSGGLFTPASVSSTKVCSGQWSGDFLNYLTTARVDALRKVLYGGSRSTDTTSSTILERAYIPQDGHAFGKEYQSVARDGYDISLYTPYTAPAAGKYLLFANTTLISAVAAGNQRNPSAAPLLRVMQNSPFRIWNWIAIEGPVAGNDCFNNANQRVACVGGGNASAWSVVPSSAFSGLTKKQWSLLPQSSSNQSSNQSDMDRLFPPNSAPSGTTRKQCGSGAASNIDGSGNQFAGSGGCPAANSGGNNNYLTQFTGTLIAPTSGTYQFAVDGDDAVEVIIDGTLVAGWFGPHGSCNYCTNHNGSINLSAGNHTITYRHQELGGDDYYRLMWAPPDPAPASRTDYTVRVQACVSGLLEENCQKYVNTATNAVTYKPVGLMQEYGEDGRMLFGLISGSYMHNHQGGVLRKQMGTFTDEVNLSNGTFVSPKSGIIATLDGLKIQGLNGNTNEYTNPNYSYNCSAGWSANQPDGSCRDWGNPIGEMMFEGLRYFAGATSGPEPEYKYTSSGSDDATLGIPEVTTWKNPYLDTGHGGLGFPSCAKPFETVVSDVNPSYDGELPGSAFGTAPSGNLPSLLSALNVSTLGSSMWSQEYGGSQQVYIGQSGSLSDSAPTVKTVSSFGNIRGLSPEEPTKQGTYYSAAVAYYGNTHDISAADGDQKPKTFSVALSSPLPRIAFPVNGRTVSLVPFSKTVSGVGVDPAGTFQPTNQIVGFYVEKIANIPGAPTDSTVNGGRPYAKFRISYEDAEQGNDYDMDAISSYEISANADNTISVHLKSEYAAGSANQHMGYVISGTSQDGLYLEVVDLADGSSSTPSSSTLYRFNTPPGLNPGACGVTSPPAACNSLPIETTRTFQTGTNAAGIVLKDPLWFAAKYGGFNDTNNSGTPDQTTEWDANGDGVPDNYFLVTNALGLKAQLQKAFDAIIAASRPSGGVSASGARYVVGGTLAYQAKFRNDDWTGDLEAHNLNSDGTLDAPIIWTASGKLPAPASRKIFISKPSGSSYVATPFTVAGLPTAMQTSLTVGLPSGFVLADVVNYLRGDQSKEVGHVGGVYRTRTTVIGDILDSTPAVAFRSGFGYQNLPATINSVATGAGTYQAFVAAKPLNPVVYVGSNDGMLHAFDGAATGGNELFGYIPYAVSGKLGRLTQPSYTHTYFVNGSPVLGDVYNGAWRTTVITSMGQGGRGLFALDVTNPSGFGAGSLMWEFNDTTDADMGTLIGTPSVPTLTQDGKWSVAVGNGYNSARNRAEMFILDANTGAKVAEIDTGVGSSTTPNGMSSAVIADTDVDGIGDVAYAGDYLGNLWKVVLVNNTWQLGNGGQPLYTAKDSYGHVQPITGGIYAIHNALGGTIVYFGTGKYLAAADADPAHVESDGNPLVNSLYAVWDRPSTNGTILKTDLQQQSILSYSGGFLTVSQNLFDYRTTLVPNGKLGWYLDLSVSGGGLLGERVISAPTGILGQLLVNAFRPTGDLCTPGGVNTFLELDLLNGSGAYSQQPGVGGGTTPPPGAGGSDTGNGPPLGTPNPIISIPPMTGIPGIGCPPSNPNCVNPPPSWCTPSVPGYPNCAPPSWCQPGAIGYPNCTPPPDCQPSTPGYPYCGGDAQQCKWFDPGTTVGNVIACRVSWRQVR